MTTCPPWVATWRARQGCGCDFCLGVEGAVYTAEHLAWAKSEAARLREVLGWGDTADGTLVPNRSAALASSPPSGGE